MPLLILLLIIIGLPLLEIAIFIQVGEAIGVTATLAAVVLGTIVGVTVVRAQGVGVFNRLRRQVNAGEPPERELFDAFCLLLAGFFILIPGFFTDTLGVLLLLPPVRGFLMGGVAKVARQRAEARGQGHTRSYRTREGVVIEGEYEELDEGRGPSGDDKGSSGQDGPGPGRLP
jgi:UPF0716 protein FxsA